MPKPKVLLVFGTRPEVIKMAPVVHALRLSDDLKCRICVTAQHREMLDQMLANFDLRPDHDLDLMRGDQDLTGFSARAMPRLQEVFREERPAFLVVQGDTTTAFVAALAAFNERIPIGHVEAGLRSFDRGNPFPEEINRVLTDRLSDLHFAPTAAARENLLAEDIPAAGITATGNTVVDALRWVGARLKSFREPALEAAMAGLKSGDKAVLVTTHRRESWGKPLEELCRAFLSLLQRHDDLHLIYPVHMNPNVQRVVRGILVHPRAHLLPSLDYFDLVRVLHRCDFVLTDSGGIQEEAPSLGKPVVILRKVTERPEAVRAGAAVLVGTNAKALLDVSSRLLRDGRFYRSMARKTGIFGDGRAGKRIAQAIRRHLGLTRRKPEAFRPGR